MVDERLTRDSHGEYSTRSSYDSAMSGGSGAGLLVAIMVIGAIVLALYFIGSGDGTAPAAGTDPAAAPAIESAAPAAPEADAATGTGAETTTGN